MSKNCEDCQEGSCVRHGEQPTAEAARKIAAVQHLHHWHAHLRPSGPPGSIAESPLMEADPDRPGRYRLRGSPDGRRLMFLIGRWDVCIHHVSRYSTVMVIRGESSEASTPVEVMTDMQLVELKYGGGEAFSERIAEPGFLVLRLGVQMSKNEELPNLVWEVCRIRETRDLPLAVINEPITPWRRGHRAWSAELDSYLSDRFLRITI